MSTLAAVTDQIEHVEAFADADRIARDLEAARLRASFFEFVKAAWPILEPGVQFVDTWHVETLAKLLQDIYTKKEKSTRWIFNIPPGTMKSLLITVLFPAWVWTKKANRRFLCGAYSQQLSLRDNLRMRDVVTSAWYQDLFPLTLQEDQNTKTRYNNSEGGWRIATTPGGAGTGEHPDFILVDDPLSAEQAESENDRQTAVRWLDRTLSTRGMTRPAILIVVMQRLHQDDPSGYLMEQGNVETVIFPMEYDPKRPDKRDKRTQAGELLCPLLISKELVEKLKKILGPYGAAGQLQQQPAPEGGGLFQRQWFKIVDALPTRLRRVRGWDTAGTKDDGDWTVGVLLGEELEQHGNDWKPTGRVYVCDVARAQLDPDDVDKLIRATAELDGRDVPVREEKEGGSAGKTVVMARAKLLRGFDYAGVQVSGDKATRAKPFRAQCQAGNVYVLKAAWTLDYITELCNFPTASHDDQLDGSSCAYNQLMVEPVKKKVKASWASAQ